MAILQGLKGKYLEGHVVVIAIQYVIHVAVIFIVVFTIHSKAPCPRTRSKS